MLVDAFRSLDGGRLELPELRPRRSVSSATCRISASMWPSSSAMRPSCSAMRTSCSAIRASLAATSASSSATRRAGSNAEQDHIFVRASIMNSELIEMIQVSKPLNAYPN
jgi:hypothetical protein